MRVLMRNKPEKKVTYEQVMFLHSFLPQKIIISTSSNIHDNLALEDWLYEHSDLRTPVLLLWRSSPCVVFGRHQNPWTECNVPFCEQNGIVLARRKSGGGTVYHDEGNLNCSFLTERKIYDRRRNLQLVVNALQQRWNLPLSINDRDDILLYQQYKVSGSAAKLARCKSYHHFTILCSVDKLRLTSILNTHLTGVSSKATPSVKMAVANLAEHVPGLGSLDVQHAITEHVLANNEAATVSYADALDETQYPGLAALRAEISSWEWTFAKTPPFTINRRLSPTERGNALIDISIKVRQGLICEAELQVLQCSGAHPQWFLTLKNGIQGVKFDKESVINALSGVKSQWINEDLYGSQQADFLDWLLLAVMQTTGVANSSLDHQLFMSA
ncbi:lipoyltransferase 1, mitochondrial-like isoform X2 [Dreissena polymorpha]|nr:lipoyltransferase 1, mitochondrial-like isoform X2 [Dreissena polymorpha]